MTAVSLGRFEPGSPEWHEARRGRLGGSEIAAVLGLSPFESRFSLWHRKAGAIGPVEETPEMEWGKRLEPVILGKFAEVHPELDIANQPGTFTHSERTWQVANPDAVAADCIIEAKFSLFGDDFGEPGTDEVPVYYRTQALWYADVLELDVIHFAVLVGGHDYREYVVHHDADECAFMRQAAEQFLDDIANNVRPDIDEHAATYQTIKELHPEIDGTDVEVADETASRFIASRLLLDAAKAQVQEATSVLADEMGDARRAVWDGQTIATRQTRGDGSPFVVAARNLGKKAA